MPQIIVVCPPYFSLGFSHIVLSSPIIWKIMQNLIPIQSSNWWAGSWGVELLSWRLPYWGYVDSLWILFLTHWNSNVNMWWVFCSQTSGEGINIFRWKRWFNYILMDTYHLWQRTFVCFFVWKLKKRRTTALLFNDTCKVQGGAKRGRGRVYSDPVYVIALWASRHHSHCEWYHPGGTLSVWSQSFRRVLLQTAWLKVYPGNTACSVWIWRTPGISLLTLFRSPSRDFQVIRIIFGVHRSLYSPGRLQYHCRQWADCPWLQLSRDCCSHRYSAGSCSVLPDQKGQSPLRWHRILHRPFW